MNMARQRAKDDAIVICFSGRGDKDCFEVAHLQGENI
jgi:tryptophan synthase beta subunit